MSVLCNNRCVQEIVWHNHIWKHIRTSVLVMVNRIILVVQNPVNNCETDVNQSVNKTMPE